MPEQSLVSKELATFLGVLSHRHRIRIIEALRGGERDVNSLREELDCSASRVSQHLSLMRSHRIVSERREGRHVYYHLIQPELADWLLDGLRFLEDPHHFTEETREAVEHVRHIWGDDDDEAAS